MKILHIANDFSETKVHANLYKELDKLGVDQTVFNPIRIKNKQSIGKNEWKAEHTRFVYAPVVKPFHRYVYHIKRRRVFRELLRSVDVKQFNLVHATTLLTDGGQAYLLYKKFHLPYVVSVRNTDINGFLDKLLHTWKDARKILLNAEKIFFISEGLKKKFYNHRAVRNIIPKIKDKFVLLPNGIEDYFVDNIKTDQRQGHGIIYIGNFTNNKNVCRLARSVIRLQQDPSFLDVRLTIIGGGQQTNNEIDEIIANNKTTINYLGRINDKQRLSEILCENSIFAMPSIHETFGLVYLEALSQNLAVVYTKGQGIDGLFDQSVGIGVNPFSEQDIYSALKKILTNRDKYNNKGVDFSQFRWQTIARKYLEHYRQVLGCADIDKSLLVSFKKILRGGVNIN